MTFAMDVHYNGRDAAVRVLHGPPAPAAVHDARMAVDAPRPMPHVTSHAPAEIHECGRAAELSSAQAESERLAVLETQARARIAQQQAPPRSSRRLGRRATSAQRKELRELYADKVRPRHRGHAERRPVRSGQRDAASRRPTARGAPGRASCASTRTARSRSKASPTAPAASQSQELSERRAAAVRLALVEEGVDGSRVFVRGYGKAFPVASNDTPEGRQRNRRVEVVISDGRGAIAPARRVVRRALRLRSRGPIWALARMLVGQRYRPILIGGELVSTGAVKQLGACRGVGPRKTLTLANLTANDENYALAA